VPNLRFEPREPKIVVAIVRADDKFLLVQRRAAEGVLFWNFPGGKVERGETELEAAAREVREETGVFCNPRRKMGERVHPDTGRLISYVLCDYDSGTAHNAEPKTARKVSWLPALSVFSRISSDIYEPVRTLLSQTMKRRIDRGIAHHP
jgi:8-oxo-dGTP diphosphatase